MQENLLGRSCEERDAADSRRWRNYFTFFALDADVTPPLALHWTMFNNIVAQRRPDGHPVQMAPFPQLPFPRRMWAGGEINWRRALIQGENLVRSSVVSRAERKSGSSGDFLLASVERSLESASGRYLDERQDVVFLPETSRPGAARGQLPDFQPEWREECQSGNVELFCYSALTLNAHRIHYDEAYAKAVEGYPALVVHGPLLATKLMHAGARRRPDMMPSRFAYRALSPTYAGECCALVGRRDGVAEQLAILGPEGHLRMKATMTFR